MVEGREGDFQSERESDGGNVTGQIVTANFMDCWAQLA